MILIRQRFSSSYRTYLLQNALVGGGDGPEYEHNHIGRFRGGCSSFWRPECAANTVRMVGVQVFSTWGWLEEDPSFIHFFFIFFGDQSYTLDCGTRVGPQNRL